MQPDSGSAQTDFKGHFESHGGSQFMANNFNTGGGPIYVDASPDNRLPTSVCELPEYILSSHFAGRGEELHQIDHALSKSPDDVPTRCVIHGMPGVGKTQLALRYATLASKNNQNMYTFWVSAGTVEKLAREFAKVVDLLCLPGRHTMDQATKMTVARAWLENTTVGKDWLLILDNVSPETTTMICHDVLPRRNDLCNSPGKSFMLALQPPSTDNAVAMLLEWNGNGRTSTENASDAELKSLVGSVGNLPLTIDQAASYMRTYNSSIKDLLRIYESKNIVEALSWENDLSHYEEKSVIATFMPALSKISRTAPDAVTLLRILCFCDPEGIPISILEGGCSMLDQEDERDVSAAVAIGLETVIGLLRSSIRLSKAIQEIQRASLAACKPDGPERILRIHDLVQLLLRSKLIPIAEREQWLEMAICIVCKAFEAIDDHEAPENWGQCSHFISHINFMQVFAQEYGLVNTTLMDANTGAAIYLGECGLYDKAADMQRRTWNQKKDILGKDHNSTLSSAHNLAWVYFRLGHYRDAEKLYVSVVDMRKPLLGEEHSDTLASTHNLALVYKGLGRLEEAERLIMVVMEINKKMLDKNDPSILKSKANLAAIYLDQGRLDEAEELVENVIKVQHRTLGKEHYSTLKAMQTLASIYYKQERLEEAEKLETDSIENSKRVLGEEHPSTLIDIGHLARTYTKQGRLKEAEKLEIDLLESSKRVLGEEHPDTLVVMNNLAWTWKEQGQNAKAVNLMQECVRLSRKILGVDHPDTLHSSEFLTQWQDENSGT